MPNHLAHETSPYLLQHADNPVDWRPWSDDAFEEARRRGVPVLLSVGRRCGSRFGGWCRLRKSDAHRAAGGGGRATVRF